MRVLHDWGMPERNKRCAKLTRNVHQPFNSNHKDKVYHQCFALYCGVYCTFELNLRAIREDHARRPSAGDDRRRADRGRDGLGAKDWRAA